LGHSQATVDPKIVAELALEPLMALDTHSLLIVYPGELLKYEKIDAMGITIGSLANAIGVSRQTVSALLNGRTALSADLAIRFEKLFGGLPGRGRT
jgi:addiction module HigA family antidote